MSDTTKTTRLDAINTMLGTIGEAPVETLDGSVPVDVQTAKSVLAEVLKEVLSQGWHFNTENDYPLTRTAEGKIIVPSNAVHVDLNDDIYRNELDVIIRGQYLYDRKNHTYIFEKDLNVTIIQLFDFEELPELVRNYIKLRAARVFQGRILGSDIAAREASVGELMSLVAMKQDEDAQADRSVFDNYSVYRVLDR
jgi:hypothetical protein